MTRLQYLTNRGVDELRRKVHLHCSWYSSPNLDEQPLETPAGWLRETSIEVTPLREVLSVSSPNRSQTDAANSLRLYGVLNQLTLRQAADERFWVWVSHYECPHYVAARWLASDSIENPERMERNILNHFFARDGRALVRDHGVSRLWWLGHIAHKTCPADPELFLEIVLHRQDIRSALIERPSVSMNREVLSRIFSVMRECWQEKDDKGYEKKERADLFKREVFRTWMTNLNRRGGVVLLDALPEKSMIELLREEAEHALKVS